MSIIAPGAMYHPADLNDAFRRWCRSEQIHDPPPTDFSRFSLLMMEEMHNAFPTTLMDTHLFSFGGADGGGGTILTAAQGEDVGRIKERVNGMSSVSPYSFRNYFRALHQKVTQPCPQAVVCEEPTDRGVALFVEDQVWQGVQERVESKPFLRRNVADMYHFDDRRWQQALEKRSARMPLWSVFHPEAEKE